MSHVVNYFKNKNKQSNGFFIEAGAFDGEMISNTLFLEVVNTEVLHINQHLTISRQNLVGQDF